MSLLRLNLLDGLPSGDAVVLVILMSFVAACGCVLLYVLVRYTDAAIRGKTVNPNKLNAKYIWVLFVVILSFWIFRNTPFYPFVS